MSSDLTALPTLEKLLEAASTTGRGSATTRSNALAELQEHIRVLHTAAQRVATAEMYTDDANRRAGSAEQGLRSEQTVATLRAEIVRFASDEFDCVPSPFDNQFTHTLTNPCGCIKFRIAAKTQSMTVQNTHSSLKPINLWFNDNGHLNTEAFMMLAGILSVEPTRNNIPSRLHAAMFDDRPTSIVERPVGLIGPLSFGDFLDNFGELFEMPFGRRP